MMPLLFRNSTFCVLLALLSAGSMWFYVRGVLVPYQRADALAHAHPRGNLSDLYPRWVGARELLLNRRDPYSPEITREIQAGYYGRPIDPARPGDPRDQQAFAYPVYVVFLLAPIVSIPFDLVRVPFYGFLLALTVATAVMWVRALRWKLSKSGIVILILMVLGSLPVAQAIELQQLTLLVAALLAGCALLIVSEQLFLGGILLALATIKPQLSLPLAAWLILWSLNNWHRRKTFLLGLFLTMGILLAAGEWILPGWPKEFLHAVVAYRGYTNGASLFDDLTNRTWGFVLSLAVSLMAIVICWRLRRDSEQSPRFIFAVALVLALTLVLVPTTSPYNQSLLLPGILLLLRDGPRLWKQNQPTRLLYTFSAAILLWPWIATVGLTIASFILPAARVQQAWAIPFYISIATPLAVLGPLLLYAFQLPPSGHSSPASAQ